MTAFRGLLLVKCLTTFSFGFTTEYSCEFKEYVLFLIQASLIHFFPSCEICMSFCTFYAGNKQYAVFEGAVDPHHIFHEFQVWAKTLYLEFLSW